MSISNGTATLSVPQTGYVGVGDEITYDGTSKAYVGAVLSPSVLVVHTATGGQPANVPGATVNSIRRAFNTIAGAVSGSSNPTHLNATDLAASGFRLTWVCYNDGPFNLSAGVTIQGYTTDATHYVTLTVAGASQTVLGASHRHRGTAGSGTRVELQSALDPAFDIRQAHTRFEWLEIDGNDLLGTTAVVTSGGGDHALLQHLVAHNLSSTNAGTTSNGIGIALTSAGGYEQVRNSFLYDFDEDGIDVSSQNVALHNCTIFRTRKIANGGEGVQLGNTATATAINVLSMVNALGSSLSSDFFVNGGGSLTCSRCISADATASGFGGSGSQGSKAYVDQFVLTTGPVDLHLRPGADATDAGSDLSGTFTDDIDGQARSGSWDVGADEYSAASAGMRVLSGQYNGNGNDGRAIFVGFQPDVVFVKRDQGNNSGLDYFPQARTGAMAGDVTKNLSDAGGAGVATYAGGIKSLDPTGFTIGTNPAVNTNGAPFYWIALKAAPGELLVGSYTGDGTDSRSITGVGFQPDYVMLLPAGPSTRCTARPRCPGR